MKTEGGPRVKTPPLKFYRKDLPLLDEPLDERDVVELPFFRLHLLDEVKKVREVDGAREEPRASLSRQNFEAIWAFVPQVQDPTNGSSFLQLHGA